LDGGRGEGSMPYRVRLNRVALAGAVAVVGLLGVAVPGVAASGKKDTLVVFAVPDQRGFVNNADDRARGKGSNPFGSYHVGVTLPPAVETKYGPFPGDVGMYTYKLYADASRRSLAGSAVLICQYGFDLTGVCDASYQFAGGTVIGIASFPAKAPSYSVEITGGTGSHIGMKGRVNTTRASGQSSASAGAYAGNALVLAPQRLVFTLHPA